MNQPALAQPDISHLNRDEREELALLLDEQQRRKDRRRFYNYYPDSNIIDITTGRVLYHRRELYPKQMAFFEAGIQFHERCLMAANRVGKTEGCGAYELTCHLTGKYPDWWVGRRWDRPIRAWMAGKTNETTRDIVQAKMFGEIINEGPKKTLSGTGVMPGDLIGKPTWKQGVQDLLDTIKIKHVSGGWSKLGVKSYQQGRGAFEGTEQDVIWDDEEPPMDIYGEQLIRTTTVDGIIMLTFTPLEGMSDVVMSFLPKNMRPSEK